MWNDRRYFIRLLGLGGLGTLAGCSILESGDPQTGTEQPPSFGTDTDTDRDNIQETGQLASSTVLENFEDGTLDGWTGSDKMKIFDGDAAAGDRFGGIEFDGSEQSGQSAKYDDGREHSSQNITFRILTTDGQNPDDEWSAFDDNDNKFLEFHNHGQGGKTGTMVNGIIKKWIMRSNTWYTVVVEDISWQNESIASVRIVDSRGTEKLRWNDLEFHESGADGFQKFEIFNMNANKNSPATTAVDAIASGTLPQSGNSMDEPPDGSNEEPECAERNAVSDPNVPGYSWDEAPVLSKGRHGPYELNLETRDSQNREHHFGVCLREGNELTVKMQFSGADMDLSIHSPETNANADQYESRPRYREIATSGSTTSNESASITADTSGIYYIRTYIVTYGTSESYELEIDVE